MRSRSKTAPTSGDQVAPTHASFVENPEHAAAVTKAIHDVVVSVRTGEPL